MLLSVTLLKVGVLQYTELQFLMIILLSDNVFPILNCLIDNICCFYYYYLSAILVLRILLVYDIGSINYL